MYQFMRDLIACRDWYDRDSGCILSRDELCDIIIFWLLIDYWLIDWLLIDVSCYCMSLYLWLSHVFLFIILYYVYDFIIK